MSNILERLKSLSNLVYKVTLESKPIVLFSDVFHSSEKLEKLCDNGFLTDFIKNPSLRNEPVRYVFLDSSYNPPTLAHHYLLRNSVLQLLKENKNGVLNIVLLLSCKNMDKHIISGASIEQRLALMELMAVDLFLEIENITKVNTFSYNCQIGLTNCGKFIDKASLIDEYLQTKNEGVKNIRKYFVMGHDTITRFFDPKYYITDYQEVKETKPVLNDLLQLLDPFFYKFNCHIFHASREASENNNVIGLKQDYFDKLLANYSEFIHKICLQPKGPKDFSSGHIQGISSTQARTELAKLREGTDSKLNEILSPSIITALKELKIY